MTGASGATRVHARSLRALLAGVIDYAGLFPPASLGMREAAAEFAEHAAGPGRWALGRFVLPADRLDELATAVRLGTPNDPWPLSVLVGPDVEAEIERITTFAAREPRFIVGAIEARAGSVADIGRLGVLLPDAVERFIELPLGPETPALVAAAGACGASAKIRTGGVTAGAFPAAEDIVGFFKTCRHSRVPFKATAGLHHPVRAEYPLTYQPDSAQCTMYGFINVLVAAALTWLGASDEMVRGALLERQADAFRFDDAGATWHSQSVPLDAIESCRRHFARAIGSCSFREPLEGLATLRLA